MEKDLFGNEIVENVLLRDKFIEPPFSVLDGRGGAWQNRKKQWHNLGIKSEVGRDAECMPSAFGGTTDANGLDKYGRKPMSGTSIFDPALCELMYHWFCPTGGKILDPFAGGSVRGVVANYLDFEYTGIELRDEQVISNRAQAEKILCSKKQPVWITGDSEVELKKLKREYDFIFSCPPYFDLEVYSDLKADLSNMGIEEFKTKYQQIVNGAVELLKQGCYACFVVGDVRDGKGFYRCLSEITIKCFLNAGLKLYNKAILLQPLGTAMLRADKVFSSNKKLVKVHEDVLIFKKL